MEEITRVVRQVRRRVCSGLVLEHSFRAAFYSACALTGYAVAAKMLFFPHYLAVLGYASALGALVSAGYAAWMARVTILSAALAADERLRLAERLSTAIDVSNDESPIARAVVEDARAVARRVWAAGAFPVSLPARSWRLGAAVAALAGVLFLAPQLDLFGRKAAYQREVRDRQEAAQHVKSLKKEAARLKEIIGEKDSEALEAINDLEARLAELEKTPLGKKETLAAVSGPMERLAERMKEMARSMSKDARSVRADLDRARQQAAMGEAAAQFDKLLEDSKTRPLSEAEKKALSDAARQLAAQMELSRGEVERALQALQGEKPSEEQLKKLAEALEKLAQQMSQDPSGSGQNDQLAQQLTQAAQQLRQSNSSEAAKSLEQSLASLDSALSGLNPFISNAGDSGQPFSGGQSPTPGTAGQMAGADTAQEIMQMIEAMQGMSGSRADLSGGMSQMSMEGAMAALRAAGSQWSNRMGPGMGGPGTGMGGSWDVGPDGQSKLQQDTVSGPMRPGRVLAAYYTKGGNIKNEVKVQLADEVLASKEQAKEALTQERVPRAYEKVVRDYFDTMDVPQ